MACHAILRLVIHFDVRFFFEIGRAGASTQLLEGRPLHFARGGGGHLHDDGALAGVPALRPHPLPPALLQARHQAPHIGAGATQGSLLRQVATQPKPARGTGAD